MLTQNLLICLALIVFGYFITRKRVNKEDAAMMRRAIYGWHMVILKTYGEEHFKQLRKNIEDSELRFKQYLDSGYVSSQFKSVYERLEERKEALELTIDTLIN